MSQSLVLYILISNIFNGIMSRIFLTSSNGLLIHSAIPIYLVLLLLIAFTYLIRKCFDIVIQKAKSSSNICKIELLFKNKKITTTGFLDTGNNLTFNNKPVSIINFKTFNSLTGISLTNFLEKKFNITNQDSVAVSTITGSKKLLTFEIEELRIKSKNKNLIYKKPNVAISLQFNNSKDYDVILNNYYLN